MELYNELIRETEGLLEGKPFRRWDYAAGMSWPDTGESELVLMRDAAYELGGGGKPAVHFTCVTTSPALVERDEILLWGPDLRELRGDTPYARIALLRVGDIESDDGDDTVAYNAIKDMEFVRYHVFPRGYMLRFSAESGREQVRVSKTALQEHPLQGGFYILSIKSVPALPGYNISTLFHHDPTFQRPGQRHLIGTLQLPAHRNSVSKPRHLHPKGLQKAA